MAETGHARIVEHFSQMISFDGYGGVYKPSNASIALAALQAKLGTSQSGIDGVTTAMAPWKTRVNERETAYEGIRKLVTRVVNSCAASGAQANAVEDAKGFKRKIDGARSKALPKDDPDTPEDESLGNSVSQRSYTQVAEHFDNLIELLSNDPMYAPNETELQIGTLQAKSVSMKNANDAVTASATPLSNSRITRNLELYGEDTGLVDLAGACQKICQIAVRGRFAAVSADKRLAIHKTEVTKSQRVYAEAERVIQSKSSVFLLKSSVLRSRSKSARFESSNAQSRSAGAQSRSAGAQSRSALLKSRSALRSRRSPRRTPRILALPKILSLQFHLRALFH